MYENMELLFNECTTKPITMDTKLAFVVYRESEEKINYAWSWNEDLQMLKHAIIEVMVPQALSELVNTCSNVNLTEDGIDYIFNEEDVEVNEFEKELKKYFDLIISTDGDFEFTKKQLLSLSKVLTKSGLFINIRLFETPKDAVPLAEELAEDDEEKCFLHNLYQAIGITEENIN